MWYSCFQFRFVFSCFFNVTRVLVNQLSKTARAPQISARTDCTSRGPINDQQSAARLYAECNERNERGLTRSCDAVNAGLRYLYNSGLTPRYFDGE